LKFPGRLDNMLHALQNVVPSHLMDRQLFPFETLVPTGVASDDGDKAFDDEALPDPATAFAKLPELQVIQLVQT
jgi:tRNA 2-thiocytidine biosynthesis protein TtcA